MERKLDDVMEYQLIVRVEISRSLRIFTLARLAEGFGISEMTLQRYASPSFRKLSRDVALRYYYQKKPNEQRSLLECHRCEKPTSKHKRCDSCTILIHGADAARGYCESCFDKVARSIMHHYSMA